MSNYLSDIHCGSFIRARINGVVCICEVLNCLEDSEGRYFQVAPLSDDGLERFYDLAGDFYVYENEILPAGMIFGHNDDLAYKNTGCALLDFFSKAGSLFTNRVSYYGEELSALDLFKLAWAEDRKLALKLLFWLRDCRGGAGNRSGFRNILRWLALSHKDWVIANLEFIPVYGRWDDFLVLQGTDCEESAFSFWSRAILAGDSLAAKWAPRARKNRAAFNVLRRLGGMGPGEFRRLLSRQTRVVETNLCEKTYSEIDYSKVPSLALGRYNRAFSRHDGDRFSAWKAAVLAGNADIHASVLFPHVVKMGVENPFHYCFQHLFEQMATVRAAHPFFRHIRPFNLFAPDLQKLLSSFHTIRPVLLEPFGHAHQGAPGNPFFREQFFIDAIGSDYGIDKVTLLRGCRFQHHIEYQLFKIQFYPPGICTRKIPETI